MPGLSSGSKLVVGAGVLAVNSSRKNADEKAQERQDAFDWKDKRSSWDSPASYSPDSDSATLDKSSGDGPASGGSWFSF